MMEEDVITLLKPGQIVLTKVSLVNQDPSNLVVSELKEAFGPDVDEAFRLTLNLHNSLHYTFSRRIRIIVKKRGFPFMRKVALSPYIEMNKLKSFGDHAEDFSQKMAACVDSIQQCEKYGRECYETACKLFRVKPKETVKNEEKPEEKKEK